MEREGYPDDIETTRSEWGMRESIFGVVIPYPSLDMASQATLVRAGTLLHWEGSGWMRPNGTLKVWDGEQWKVLQQGA